MQTIGRCKKKKKHVTAEMIQYANRYAARREMNTSEITVYMEFTVEAPLVVGRHQPQ